MSGAGYDVVVDVDEEGDLGHTDLQEDLEFHNSDFVNEPAGGSRKGARSGLPPPATSSSSKRYLWSLAFYSQYFDVDTTSVLSRCWAALYPRANFLDVLEGNPDLYGPFWIATTVIFILFLGGTISQYLAHAGDGQFEYDFRLLSGAAGLIYGYTLFIPCGLFLALRYFGSESANLLECWALYGYSNLIWIPVACIAWSQLTLLNWIFVGVGFAVSVAFLLRNLYPVLSATDKQTSKILLVVVVALHAGLALAIKILFFAHGSPVAKQPSDSKDNYHMLGECGALFKGQLAATSPVIINNMASQQQMPMPAMPPLQPGQRPSPQQMQAIQRQLAIDAEKHGMTVPQFVEKLKEQAAAKRAAFMAAQAQAQGQAENQGDQPKAPPQQQQPQPIKPGPPNPAAVAVAKFLRSQDLKPRTCILNGQRKDMFRVKRALRALQTPAYEAARKKNSLLPEITDRASLENTFKLMPLSLLALRVTKIEPADKAKRVKGLWNVRIEQQQDCHEDLYYVWLYEGSQIKQKLYAAGALAIVFAVVMFPLWPMTLRLGVWYLSMGMLGLIGLFFAMAIFRLILFVVTVLAVPPGLWLFPNLFEDVGFFDSFKPVWGWQEEKKKKKKKVGSANAGATMAAMTGQPLPATATTTSAPEMATARGMAATVEDVEE